MAHKCHGKRKKLPAKEKLPRQKKNARGKKEIGHGKRKKLAAKEKCSRQKRNWSRLLLRLKFRSARGASRHPAFMGNCQTISHTPHSPTYPVDEGSEV